jgi:hypothetical protein
MWIVCTLFSLAFMFLVLRDCFEAIFLPRRVNRPYRPTRLYYLLMWPIWTALARRIASGRRRETFLSFFGPLSTLGLFAAWVVGLVIAFGLLHWSLGSTLHGADGAATPWTYIYMSGVTFFTLGIGDVTATDGLGRFLTVVEAGLGFGFLAAVIGYLPVLYQAFSRREVTISMLDARAGSPPSAAQLLLRLAWAHDIVGVNPFLREWERWSAEVLESHLSFPMLSFYRSQHDNQSWVVALTTVLDTSALVIAGVQGADTYQAQLTFAMARHAAVDLALVFRTPPIPPDPDRLPAARLHQLAELLRESGVTLHDGPLFAERLHELRDMYEPFVNALARRFLFTLPPVFPEKPTTDNWQTSAWTRRTPGIQGLPGAAAEEHFD